MHTRAQTLIGLVIWCTYTAMGLAILPIRLLAIRARDQLSGGDIDTQLIVNREQTRAIETRYARPADRANMRSAALRPRVPMPSLRALRGSSSGSLFWVLFRRLISM